MSKVPSSIPDLALPAFDLFLDRDLVCETLPRITHPLVPTPRAGTTHILTPPRSCFLLFIIHINFSLPSRFPSFRFDAIHKHIDCSAACPSSPTFHTSYRISFSIVFTHIPFPLASPYPSHAFLSHCHSSACTEAIGRYNNHIRVARNLG